MTYNNVLHALVHRAATYSRPFNNHDAFLLLRSLHALRYRSDDVRPICEKCAFAITSSRISVPVDRAVEALNALVSLQATATPIVHERLAKRLLEVSPQTASPQTTQKAAVVIMKLGRRYCKREIAAHILSELIRLAHSHPNDVALCLAVISVFPFTMKWPLRSNSSGGDYESEQGSGTEQADGRRSCTAQDEKAAAVLAAAQNLINKGVLGTLRGNSALQAMHLYLAVLLYASATTHVLGRGVGADCELTDGAWDHVCTALENEFQSHTVVAGGYAQFLHDFLPVFLSERNNALVVERVVSRVLAPVFHRDFHAGLNSYDVAKIATAISNCLEKRGSCLLHSDGKDVVCTLLAQVVRVLVKQLAYFYASSWSRTAKRDRSAGGRRFSTVKVSNRRVDQVVVGAVWHALLKCATGLPHAGGVELSSAMEELLTLTESIAGELNSLWSWVFYSISTCACILPPSERLWSVAKSVAKKSFLSHCRSERGDAKLLLPRYCVQALYAASLWGTSGATCNGTASGFSSFLSPELANGDNHTCGSVPVASPPSRGVAKCLEEDHHLLVNELLNTFKQYRFGDYSSDDMPMLLQALCNLMELKNRFGDTWKADHSSLNKATEAVLHYVVGMRHSEWHKKHGVAVSCTLVAMCEWLRNCALLNRAVRHVMSSVSLLDSVSLDDLCRLLKCVVALKRREPSASARIDTSLPSTVECSSAVEVCSLVYFVSTHTLSLAARTVEEAQRSRKDRNQKASAIIRVAGLAQKLGAVVVFCDSTSGTSTCKGNGQEANVGVELASVALDISAMVSEGKLNQDDAAHVLYLMSRETGCSWRLYHPLKQNFYIEQLRAAAICAQSFDNVNDDVLLHLIWANENAKPSKLLFDVGSLEAVMQLVCHHLKKRAGRSLNKIPDAKLWKIVRCLLESQVLIRLNCTLKKYPGLPEAVNNVLDAVEAAQTERPETVFKLRLLCGER